MGIGLYAVTSPVLAVENLTVEVRAAKKKLTVVDGVRVEVARGETLAIVGESGAGKSARRSRSSACCRSARRKSRRAETSSAARI